MSASLRFISNDADEDEGLNNAGIETFRDAPFAGIARECGQNSLDAAIDAPATLRFDLLEISADEFPSIDDFRETFNACRRRSQERQKRDEFLFFTNALTILREAPISVLRISDEGTLGLEGPCVQGTPFHALVKSAGVSEKGLETAGGSFGIGKHAAYAVSDLRTVFYSTMYVDPDGNEQFLAQGKSILVSHVGNDGLPKKASGYWGADGYQPVASVDDVPDWMRRDRRGTSIFAAGFPEAGDWALRVAESLLRNFFAAVHRGTIRFCIDNESIVIDNGSLPELFADERIRQAAEDNLSLEDFTYSKHLYECLVDEQTKTFNTKIPTLGSMQMHVAVRDYLPKRVFLIRNGMVITDNLQYFNDKLIRFPMFRDFIALVEPEDDKASKLIKRLEDPKHRDLSAERLIDRREQNQVKRAMRELINWIRASIRNETFEEPEDEVEVDELSEFFADVSADPPIADPKSKDTNPEKFVYKPLPTRRSGTARDATGDHGGGGGTRRAKKKAKTKDGRGKGAGAGGRGARGVGSRIQYRDFRNVPSTDNPMLVRDLYFTPSRSGAARLIIEAAGLNSNEMLSIATLNGQHLASPRECVVELQENERSRVEVQFDQEFDGPVELILVEESDSPGNNG